MDEDSEWDDFGHDDSSDDDSSHRNDSNDLQNLDPDDFGTSDVGSWLQENRHAWKTAPAIEDWTRIRTACSTSKKAWDLNMAIEAAFREFKIALSSDMSGESNTPSSQGAMALAMKLQTEQSNDNGEINQNLAQMLEKMNTMETRSTAALESEIEKLTGKLGKVEGNITELQKKSTQQSHLLDEVAEKIKSGNASNTSNVPKLHQQSQNHTQALLNTATGRFSAATSISEGHRRLPTNNTHPTVPRNGWASVASPTTSGPTPSGARRPSAPTTPDPEAQPSGGKCPASAATSPSQPSKRSKATNDIRAKKDELLKQFLRK
ncbi:unnamed protein product [Fusarium graminearum]|nr:hypothetical protein FG05_01075 [Fusarium graminearum]CZS76412.1 unnamed protein product [Fusarium graminearum]